MFTIQFRKYFLEKKYKNQQFWTILWCCKLPMCYWEETIDKQIEIPFSNFSYMFLNPNNLLDLRNLQEQAKKAFCYQK